MERSPSWEANRFSASHVIARILCNPKVHYSVYKYPLPFLILSQINPVHYNQSHFLKIHLHIILPSMPGTSKWPLSLRFPHQNPVYSNHFPHTCYMPRPEATRGSLSFSRKFTLYSTLLTTSRPQDSTLYTVNTVTLLRSLTYVSLSFPGFVNFIDLRTCVC